MTNIVHKILYVKYRECAYCPDQVDQYIELDIDKHEVAVCNRHALVSQGELVDVISSMKNQ